MMLADLGADVIKVEKPVLGFDIPFNAGAIRPIRIKPGEPLPIDPDYSLAGWVSNRETLIGGIVSTPYWTAPREWITFLVGTL